MTVGFSMSIRLVDWKSGSRSQGWESRAGVIYSKLQSALGYLSRHVRTLLPYHHGLFFFSTLKLIATTGLLNTLDELHFLSAMAQSDILRLRRWRALAPYRIDASARMLTNHSDMRNHSLQLKRWRAFASYLLERLGSTEFSALKLG